MPAAALETEAAPAAPLATRPFSAFEWMIALRYLRARRAHGSISVIAGFSFLGIVLGVAALIVVMAVMNGFRHDLLDKLIGLNGHMFLEAVETPLTDYDAVTDRVSKVPGVALAMPLIEGQAFASSAFGSSGALVRGVREADLEAAAPASARISRKARSTGSTRVRSVSAIGAKLADHLSLRVGDKINLLAPHGAQTPFGITPRMKAYPVAAVFQIGMSNFDGSFVFMPLSEAQAYFNLDGVVNLIEVYLDDPDGVDAMRPRITAA